MLATLNHPLIAQVYGFEQSGDTRAIVMELVEGPTLEERIAQGKIVIPDALRIARQIAEALESAHDLGIIHRDLKPAKAGCSKPRRPRPWSPVRHATAGPTRKFDLHPDGKRVIVASPDTTGVTAYDKVVFVINFFAELERLLPPGR